MPFSVQSSDLMRTLNPASVKTRAAYSFGMRPWTPGELVRVESQGAAGYAGFNYPGRLTTDKLESIAAQGRAAAAAAFAYTTRLDVPATANITAAENYLNAVLVMYPGEYYKTRGDGILVPRIAAGGALPAVGALGTKDPYWRQSDTNEIEVVFGSDGATNYYDVPKGWILELVIPAAGDITLTELAAAGQQALPTYDYIAADTSTVNVSRIFS